jgi:hypothetical protein
MSDPHTQPFPSTAQTHHARSLVPMHYSSCSCQMAGLTSLPFELLHKITWLVCDSPPPSRSLTNYEAKALGVMRSVCMLMNAVAEPMLFHHLVMTINPAGLNSPWYSQLRDLVERKTAASSHAKALTLRISHGAYKEAGHAFPGIGELACALDTLCNVNSVM